MSNDNEIGIVENNTEKLLGFNVVVGDNKKFVRLVPGENELDSDTFKALKASEYFKAHKEKKNVSYIKPDKKKKKDKKDKKGGE